MYASIHVRAFGASEMARDEGRDECLETLAKDGCGCEHILRCFLAAGPDKLDDDGGAHQLVHRKLQRGSIFESFISE